MAGNIEGYEKGKFATSSLQRYTCSKCYKVMRDPIGCCRCTNWFCRSCTMNSQNPSDQICFWCKKKVDVDATLRERRKLKKEIDNLPAYCAYRDIGCQKIVPLRLLHDHVHSCEFAERFNCAHCGGTVNMQDFRQFRSTQESSYIS